MRRVLGLVVAGAGCAAPVEPLGPPEASPWAAQRLVPGQHGCGDLVLVGSASGDTEALFVHASGLAEAAHRAGRTIRGSSSFPSSEVAAVFQRGTDLTSATCVGAYPFPGPVVDREWQAVGGTVHMTVTPDLTAPMGMPLASVDAVLRDVVFVESGTGRSFVAPHLRFDDVTVGFYPP